jgi:hypothetical protein
MLVKAKTRHGTPGLSTPSTWVNVSAGQARGAVAIRLRRGYGGIDQRDDMFLDDVDRHDLVRTLAEARQETYWSRFGIGSPGDP